MSLGMTARDGVRTLLNVRTVLHVVLLLVKLRTYGTVHSGSKYSTIESVRNEREIWRERTVGSPTTVV